MNERRDLVFDHSGKYLYITTSDGSVRQYNLQSEAFEKTYYLGGSLAGADIAPDDSFLLVAQASPSEANGVCHKLNLSNGEVTDLPYTRAVNEGGAWDVAIASNGLAFLTTIYNGTGYTPLRQIDLSSNAISERHDVPGAVIISSTVEGETQIRRSADRTRLYFLSPDGGVLTYSAVTDSFGRFVQADMYFSLASAAVNRNGTLVSTLVNLQAPYPFALSRTNIAVDTPPEFHFVHSLSEPDSGLAFDAVADVLYAVSSSAKQIIAYDTNNFSEKYRFNIEERMPQFAEPFGTGTLVASQDGRYLGLETLSGIRIFRIPGDAVPPVGRTATLATRRDLVFEHAGRFFYLTTSAGLVERYELSTGRLDIIADLGGRLSGIDIAPDDSYLLIARDNVGILEGAVSRFDLITGSADNITYPRTRYETGSSGVAIGSNGRALITTSSPPGFTVECPLHEIDVATRTMSVWSDAQGKQELVTADTRVVRSADRTRVYLLEPNSSAGPVLSYSFPLNAITARGNTSSFHDISSAAVSRDGVLVATRFGFSPAEGHALLQAATDLRSIDVFNFDGGVAFDGSADILYGVDSRTSEILGYNTNTLEQIQRISIGEGVSPGATLFGAGNLRASDDGRYLALTTASGVRFIPIPPTGHFEPASGSIGVPRGVVFDNAGTHLYITTANGFVWPYNTRTFALEKPYYLGGLLNGVDISRDDSQLVVADEFGEVRQGFAKILNLRNRAVTNVSLAGGGWDIAITGNGKAFATTTALTPLREINLQTNAVTDHSELAGGWLDAATELQRSADGERLVVAQLSGRSPNAFTYDSSTDMFHPAAIYASFYSSLAVNRNGSLYSWLIGSSTSVSSLPDSTLLHTFNNISNSSVFSGASDTLYGIDPGSDQIIAYDSNTFAELSRIPVGEDVSTAPPQKFHEGTLKASPDGRYLAFVGKFAIRVFDLVAQTTTAISTVAQFADISTRAVAGTGDNVVIAGFIIEGTVGKKILVRAIGSSLSKYGVTDALDDPTLELHDQTGAIIATNNDWRESQAADINATGLAPTDDREAAIMQTLAPGSYTAIMRGNNETTGVGLLEVYDVEPASNSRLVNISTRAYVGTGDDVIIAGVIVAPQGGANRAATKDVLFRGIGPSLTAFGVPNALQDPSLTVYNSNGTVIAGNDDWRPNDPLLRATGRTPTDSRESAVVTFLSPGAYTAILRGANNKTGVGLIEAYALEIPNL